MRTLWLGLAVLAMAVAAWASDESEAKVGDWVKDKQTRVVASGKEALPSTTVVRVKTVEDGTATLEIKTTWPPFGSFKPRHIFKEVKVSVEHLNFLAGAALIFPEGMKVEVVERKGRTTKVNGKTFADVLLRRIEVTTEARDGVPAMKGMAAVWEDGTTPFPLARILKMRWQMTWLSGSSLEIFTERVAYGRADDPIPEDEEISDKE